MSDEGTWVLTPAGNRVFRPAMVTCRECWEAKPRADMHHAGKHMGWCNACRRKYRRRQYLEGRTPPVRHPRRDAQGNWRCSSCLAYLPLSGFQMRDRGHGPEPHAYCRECRRERDARYRAEMREAMAVMRKGMR